MPINIITNRLKIKNDQGQYVSIDAVTDKTTNERVTEINTAGATQLSQLNARGEQLKNIIIAPTRVTDDDGLGIIVEAGTSEMTEDIIEQRVDEYLDHVVPPQYIVDDDLDTTGAAADAKITGDKLRDLEVFTNALAVKKETTDKTLEQENVAADAKSVGDEFTNLRSYLDSTGLYVTPQMYGAKADGTTDDATAIQDAINSGKVVYIPKGNYCITSTLVIPSTPTDAVGARRTIILGDYNSTLIYYRGNENAIENNGELYLENIRVESNGINENGLLTKGRIKLYHCQFNGNGENGLMFYTDNNISHCIVEDCVFYGNKLNGITCYSLPNAQKNNIIISKTYCVGNGTSSGNTIAQNDGNGNGINLRGIYVVDVYNCVLQNNTAAGLFARSRDRVGILTLNVRDNYYEGNRLANNYIYNSDEFTYRNINITGNYYTIYPATSVDYYTNSLFSISTKTVISNKENLVECVIDPPYVPKITVNTITTDSIEAGSVITIANATLTNNIRGSILSIIPVISTASSSAFDVLYRLDPTYGLVVKNTYSVAQTVTFKVTIFSD